VWEPKLPHLTTSVARLVYSAKWPVLSGNQFRISEYADWNCHFWFKCVCIYEWPFTEILLV